MVREKTCLIFGAGEYDNIEPRLSEADLIIAADGGYSWLRERGIRPDLLVGDLDSLGYVPEGVDLLRLRPEKDDTDMAIAIAEGEARGCGRFIMYGGLGGRLDHTYANIQLAAGLSRQGKQVFILSGACCITAVHQGGAAFQSGYSGYLSVFAFGRKASGVFERGLKYRLDDAVMYDDRTLGVSNEFTGEASSVEVRDGTLILMWQGNQDMPLPEIY